MAGFGADAVLIAHGSKHLDTVRMLLSHGAHNEPGSDYEVGPRLLDERVLGQLKSWIDTCAVIALENRPEIVEFIKHVRKRLDATIEDNKRRALEEMGIGSGEEDKRLGHDEKAAVKRVDTAPEPAALGFIVLGFAHTKWRRYWLRFVYCRHCTVRYFFGRMEDEALFPG